MNPNFYSRSQSEGIPSVILNCRTKLAGDVRLAGTLHWPSPILSRPWSGTHPLLSFAVLRSWSSRGPLDPLLPHCGHVAAANVNPCTRLSHMIPFLGRDWCTRERCRLMMQKSQNSMRMTLRFSHKLKNFTGFWILRESRTSPRARAHHPHPLGASCVFH